MAECGIKERELWNDAGICVGIMKTAGAAASAMTVITASFISEPFRTAKRQSAVSAPVFFVQSGNLNITGSGIFFFADEKGNIHRITDL